MFKTDSKTIGGLEYRVSQLGAVKGRAVFLRIVKLVGPAIASVVKGGKIDMKNVDLGDLFKRVELTEEDLTFFCDAFAEKTFVVLPDKKAPRLDHVFDAHFAGKYGDMMQWLVFCVSVNFADFFVAAELDAAEANASAPTVTARN